MGCVSRWLKRWFRKYELRRNGVLYMTRWIIFPWHNLPNIYIHKFTASDQDKYLHDHPWSFFSFIIKGWLLEWRPTGDDYDGSGSIVPYRRGCFSLCYYDAEDAHRVVLPKSMKSVWTICLVGRRRRNWGFYTPEGWVDWNTHLGIDARLTH